jgi:XTP/dITP diphosphohydrolase
MTTPGLKLTIATYNPGKVAEYRQLLERTGIDLAGLGDFYGITEVAETGETFAENAKLKAAGYALQTGTATLADDSGLMIDALGGRPGVFSARYGTEGMDFAGKMQRVLDEIRASGSKDRSARFVCEIAIANRHGEIVFAAGGKCEGTIANVPKGTGGFGYDPIFIPKGFDETFGELPDTIKQEISHRARAFAQIIPYLRYKTLI